MSILLLTGPPASGKNTIGEQMGKNISRCAVIDVDALHRMIVSPNRSFWEGDEGHEQVILNIENACALARNFDAGGYQVIISDTLTEATLELYKKHLAPLTTFTVLLLPSKEEITSRLLSRLDYLSRGQVDLLYDQQSSFGAYDEMLDNTNLSIAQAIDWVKERWPEEK